MAESILSNRPETGKTFPMAMWVIGGIAALQIFGVVWAVLKRPAVGLVEAKPEPVMPLNLPPMPLNPGGPVMAGTAGNSPTSGGMAPDPNSGSLPPAPAPSNELEAPSPVFSGNDPLDGSPLSGELRPGEAGSRSSVEQDFPGPGSVSSRGTPVLDGPNFLGPAGGDATSLSQSLTDASFSSDEIADPIIERLVSTGVELRSADNMQGALQALKEAEAAMPDHPRIMSELAATYQQMGLDEKANGYWERVESLGEIVAGNYYAIAGRQLRGEEVPGEGDVRQIMKIGRVVVEEKPPGDATEQIAARIVIESDPEFLPDGEQLSVLVFFYDQVEGGGIEPSTADTSYLYPTEPYDWRVDGKEEIIVNYSQPVFSEEQKRELGERKYFGYVIQLYYQDELQDKIVMPPELEQYHMDAPLNPSQEPERLEPENALFPESPGP